ncbi:MAG: DUF393 domain-containing protein [Rhodospirillaceae bacterium]|nr:DUF393 domain-containing protein [Rhodospirillaceae bacterium]
MIQTEVNKYPAVTLFYDGGCPMCDAEITLYKKMDTTQCMRFIDITDPSADLPLDLDKKTALSRFHVLTRDERVLSGVLAFSEVWKQLPRWRWAGFVASQPVIREMLEVGYKVFLRYCRPFMGHFIRSLRKGVNPTSTSQ